MRTALIILSIFLFAVRANGQVCNCPSNIAKIAENPVQLFRFSNKKTLAICGYRKIEKRDTTYSEFKLLECGQDTVIAEWDGTQSCIINWNNDTLIIKELSPIPIGRQFENLWKPFYEHQYWFKSGQLKTKGYFNTANRTYSLSEIQSVLTRYKNLKVAGNYDEMLQVSKMLFWAYVSDNKEAEVYLNQVEKRFGPFDGGISEEWNEIFGIYEFYKIKKSI